jgi:hypothetical protein
LKTRNKKIDSKLKEPMAKAIAVCEARPSEVVPPKKPRQSSGSKRSTLDRAKPSSSLRADRGLAATRGELAERRLDGSLARRFNKKNSDCETAPSHPTPRQARVVEHR